MLSLNTSLFLAIQKLATVSVFWDTFFLIVTTSLSTALFIIIIAYVLWHHHRSHHGVAQSIFERWKEILTITGSVAVTFGLVSIIKVLVALPRPFLAIPDIQTLLVFGANNSFPSNHSAIFAALAISLYPKHTTLSIAVGMLALLIGFSRIYVGVHYPLDVVAGFLIGGLIAWGTRRLFNRKTILH